MRFPYGRGGHYREMGVKCRLKRFFFVLSMMTLRVKCPNLELNVSIKDRIVKDDATRYLIEEQLTPIVANPVERQSDSGDSIS